MADKKNILIVTTHPTHPINAGNRSAIMAQANLYKKMGCNVYLLYAETSLRPNNYRAEMEQHWGERLIYFNEATIWKLYHRIIDKIRVTFNNSYWKCDDHYVFGLEDFTNKINRKIGFDACIVQYMRLSKLLPNITIARKAIFTHDVFSYKDLRTGDHFYETVEASQEAKAMQRCPNIFAIQDNEATYYRFLSPLSKVFTVYNPYNITRQKIQNSSTILFLAGEMDFNTNGILWFLDNVWSQLHEELPQLQLRVGGTVCKGIEKEYPNVTKLGFIDNLAEFYSDGDIVINPVFQGTGLKIKTFEALSFGKVVIANPHSLNGIFDPANAPIIPAKSKDEWIYTIKRMIGDQEQISKMQSKAIEYITSMNRHIENQYNEFLSQ